MPLLHFLFFTAALNVQYSALRLRGRYCSVAGENCSVCAAMFNFCSGAVAICMVVLQSVTRVEHVTLFAYSKASEEWKAHRVRLGGMNTVLLRDQDVMSHGLNCTGAPDGHPLASNNGVERDGETKRLTVHCADKNCKKRQCKAVRLSCKTTPMNDLILTRIRTQMQVPNRCLRRFAKSFLVTESAS